MEYSLERLKIEQIVVTERYASDTSQWDKLRSFWHPDSWQTSLKISWFNGTIDQYITELRTTDGINPQMKKQSKHVMGLSKHIVHPVDVTKLCAKYMEKSDRVLLCIGQIAGEWKIVSFECIYNNDDIATLANLGERGFDMKVKRESYKCLAYVVEKTQGHKLDENLPRWDRPKEAMQVLDEARKWIIG